MQKGNKLGFWTKLGFGSGEIPAVTSKTVMSMLFMFFLTDIVGILPAVAGSIFMIGRLWDAVTDPVIGMLSDRTHTRWGRRRPYILFSAVPLGVFFFLLWLPYPVESLAARTIVYTIVFILYMTVLTTYCVPYLGLMAELTDDYSERTSVNNFRIFFSMLFGLFAAVVPKMIADSYDDKQQGYMVAASIVMVFVIIFPFVVFKVTHERFGATAIRKKMNFRQSFSAMIRNKAFLAVLFVYVGSLAAINVIEGFVVYYMKYWILREKEMPIVFVSVVLSTILTLPLWPVMSKKYGKRFTVIFGLVFWAITQMGWFLLAPASPTYIVCIVGFVVGIGYGCVHVLPWAMFPDVLDQDELTTGERNEGAYSGIMTFCMKMGNSLAMFFIGLVLQFTGYQPNVPQKGAALEAIRSTMTFGPLLFILIGLIAAWFFPITKDVYQKIQTELQQKREQTVEQSI